MSHTTIISHLKSVVLPATAPVAGGTMGGAAGCLELCEGGTDGDTCGIDGGDVGLRVVGRRVAGALRCAGVLVVGAVIGAVPVHTTAGSAWAVEQKSKRADGLDSRRKERKESFRNRVREFRS